MIKFQNHVLEVRNVVRQVVDEFAGFGCGQLFAQDAVNARSHCRDLATRAQELTRANALGATAQAAISKSTAAAIAQLGAFASVNHCREASFLVHETANAVDQIVNQRNDALEALGHTVHNIFPQSVDELAGFGAMQQCVSEAMDVGRRAHVQCGVPALAAQELAQAIAEFELQWSAGAGWISESQTRTHPSEDGCIDAPGQHFDEDSIDAKKEIEVQGDRAEKSMSGIALRLGMSQFEVRALLQRLASPHHASVISGRASLDRMVLIIARVFPHHARALTELACDFLSQMGLVSAPRAVNGKDRHEDLSAEDAEQFEFIAHKFCRLLRTIWASLET